MMYCDKHRPSMPISECPICVREERDRYRKALANIVDSVESVMPASHTWAVAMKALEGKA